MFGNGRTVTEGRRDFVYKVNGAGTFSDVFLKFSESDK